MGWAGRPSIRSPFSSPLSLFNLKSNWRPLRLSNRGNGKSLFIEYFRKLRGGRQRCAWRCSNSRLASPIPAPAFLRPRQDFRMQGMNIAHHLSTSSWFFISYRFRPSPGIFDLGKRRSSLKLASRLSKRITRCQIDGVS